VKGKAHQAGTPFTRRVSLPDVRIVGFQRTLKGLDMKFQVGKFTCEVLVGDNGKLLVKWFPEPPKYLNKAERDQYQAGVAEFLEELERRLGKDRSNLPRLKGSGCS
jgi:hypothetical protein